MGFFTTVLNESIELQHVPDYLLVTRLEHCDHEDKGDGTQSAPTKPLSPEKLYQCKPCSNSQGETQPFAHIAHTSSGTKKMLSKGPVNLLLSKLHTVWHQNLRLTEQTLPAL